MQEHGLPEELRRCVEFHGHLCPGLVIGYSAAKLGMQKLAANHAVDEELIAIVENDTCAVDAIQVLAGCTFGKGNLFFLDYGKMAFTFANRVDDSSVRLYFRAHPPPQIENLPEEQCRQQYIDFLLAQDPEVLFDQQKDILHTLPSQARIRESISCEICGEKVISTRQHQVDGKQACIPCLESIG